MKSGASDPFADGDNEETETEPEQDQTTAEAEQADTPSQTAVAETETSGDGQQTETPSKNTGDGERQSFSRDELPYILRRDKVKDERPEVHQLFVQEDTHDQAFKAERELKDSLGEDLSRTDAREAIYRVGMMHLDDAETMLRAWGYDI